MSPGERTLVSAREHRDDEAADTAGAGVGRAATGGVVWLTAQKWAVRLFGFVTIAILTRLLSPADFGTLAAASTVLPFFYLLADLGFAAYIVQADKVTDRLLSTAFWFSISAGTVLCGALWLCAPLMGAVFGNDDVTPVLRVLSLWVIFTALGSVPMALMRREMRFGVIAAQGAAAAVAAQIVAIVLAFAGFGVWTLVAQSLVAAVLTTILIWCASSWRPRWMLDIGELGRLSSFGGKVLGVEFVAMSRAWGETAITSAVLGAAALGAQSIAQRLVQIVQDLTGSAVVPVTNVAFAKLRNEVDRLRTSYLRALKLVILVLSLPLTVVAVCAPLLVPLLFGPGWEQSIPVAQVLALAGVLAVAAWLDHGLFYGIGRPGTWFVYALVVDAVTVATTAMTVRWGLVVIAYGFLGVTIVATVSRWFLVRGVLGVRLRALIMPFLCLITVVVLSGTAGLVVMSLTAELPHIAALLIVVPAIGLVHVGVSVVCARPVIIDALLMVRASRWGARLPGLQRMGRVR